MSASLNKRGYEHARRLIRDGHVVADSGQWSEHQPSPEAQDEFLDKHGIDEYAKWFLGVDEAAPAENKSRYKFPYGDFRKVHRCGVLAAQSRAGRNHNDEIHQAVVRLHEMIDDAR